MIKIEKILDLETGEETIIEREETGGETKERLESQATKALEQAEQSAKNAAKQAVLDKLGLTADEVAALLG